MKEQAIETVKNLLETKDSMEKALEFSSNAMRRVREANPVARIKVLQLQRDIKNFKESNGEARRSAAAILAKSLVAPSKPAPKPVSKPAFCTKCGAQLTPGATFCGNCGAKMS